MMTRQTAAASNLYLFSLFLSISTFILIIAGGLVTSHEAGLAVPDWPLSFGRFFPPMVGNIFWEHGHRMIAGTVGLLTLGFAVTVQIAEERSWVKKFAWVMVASVILQALLGGLTVKMLLPPPVSIFHACLGQIFFCLTVSMAYFMSQSYRFKHPEINEFQNSFQKLVTNTLIVGFVQLLLGAGVRHTGNHLVIGVHVINALILVIMIAILFIRSPASVSKASGVAGILALLQIVLGAGSLVFTQILERQGYAPSAIEIFFTSTHQSLSALVLGLLTWLALRVKS